MKMATKDEALKMAMFMATDIRRGYAPTIEFAVRVFEACKEALEQPAQDCQYGKDVVMPEYSCTGKCQYAQPAQEPVAWMYQTEDENFKTDTLSVGYEPTFDGKIIPLYTHPAPSWQGLSDDEIRKVIIDEQIPVRTGKTANRFARAIEAKLKEKNHD